MPDFVTKVPFTSYQSALHCMLRKFPMVVTKVPFHVTKVPDFVTKVPFTSYQSAPCYESSLWSLQKCPKMLLKCPVLVTKVPFPLALSLSVYSSSSTLVPGKTWFYKNPKKISDIMSEAETWHRQSIITNLHHPMYRFLLCQSSMIF